jgi:regulator of protease activity HflC (stomatin/prohibitin superfamily)
MFDRLIDVLLQLWRYITPCHWINPWEAGVRISYGPMRWWPMRLPEVVELAPGIHLKLPGFQRVHTVVAATQTLNLPPQSCTTADRKKVNVGGVVRYNIRSAIPHFTKIHDQDDVLRDVSMGAIEDAIIRRTLEEVFDVDVKMEIAKEIRKGVHGKGYEIEEFKWTDRQQHSTIRLIQNEPKGY